LFIGQPSNRLTVKKARKPMSKGNYRTAPPILHFFVVAAFLTAAISCGQSNESARDRQLQPERLMDAIGVVPGMTVAEPGCGAGYFTFKLAHRVGPTGKVYAEDISRSALDKLAERRDREGVANIVTILGEVEDPLLPAGEMDMVVIVQAVHSFDKPVELLVNLKPCLKPGALVVDIDIDPDKLESPSHHFPTADQVKSYFEQAGYEFVRSEDFLEQHLVMLFRVKTSG
jgi:ubiquinone/menaquinone biosynthesis C-methylase UbiE